MSLWRYRALPLLMWKKTARAGLSQNQKQFMTSAQRMYRHLVIFSRQHKLIQQIVPKREEKVKSRVPVSTTTKKLIRLAGWF